MGPRQGHVGRSWKRTRLPAFISNQDSTHSLKTQGSPTTRTAVESIEQGKPAEVASSLSSSLSHTATSLQSTITDPNLSHGQKLDSAIRHAKQAGQGVMGTISTSVGRLPQNTSTLKGRSEDLEQLEAPSASAGTDKDKTSMSDEILQAQGVQEAPAAQQQTTEPKKTETPGQAVEAIESEIKAATSEALDTIPQSVRDTALKATTSKGQSELLQSAETTLASATDFTIPPEKLDDLSERFRVLIVDGFGSRPEFKKGWEDLLGMLGDAWGRLRNLQGEMTDVGREWTIEARGDADKAVQGGLEISVDRVLEP
jgi:hypothetical protein